MVAVFRMPAGRHHINILQAFKIVVTEGHDSVAAVSIAAFDVGVVVNLLPQPKDAEGIALDQMASPGVMNHEELLGIPHVGGQRFHVHVQYGPHEVIVRRLGTDKAAPIVDAAVELAPRAHDGHGMRRHDVVDMIEVRNIVVSRIFTDAMDNVVGVRSALHGHVTVTFGQGLKLSDVILDAFQGLLGGHGRIVGTLASIVRIQYRILRLDIGTIVQDVDTLDGREFVVDLPHREVLLISFPLSIDTLVIGVREDERHVEFDLVVFNPRQEQVVDLVSEFQPGELARDAHEDLGMISALPVFACAYGIGGSTFCAALGVFSVSGVWGATVVARGIRRDSARRNCEDGCQCPPGTIRGRRFLGRVKRGVFLNTARQGHIVMFQGVHLGIVLLVVLVVVGRREPLEFGPVGGGPARLGLWRRRKRPTQRRRRRRRLRLLEQASSYLQHSLGDG
mmetsp:Transcript_40739/g.122724  ORF Transcript_40739/g.122724 Transcript_40739/m.122724 type:complete len:450 (-) Transcript_40739:172-1521(-)